MTSRAAVYLRISDPKGDTADRFGLAVQERACCEYAERTGLNVQRVLHRGCCKLQYLASFLAS